MADGTIQLKAELDVDTSDLSGLLKDIQYIQKLLDKLEQKPIEIMSDKEVEKVGKLHDALDSLKMEVLDKGGVFEKFGLGDVEFIDMDRARQTFSAFGYDLDEIYNELTQVKHIEDEPLAPNNFLGETLKLLTGIVGAGAFGMLKSSFNSLNSITAKAGSGIKRFFENIRKGAHKGAMSMKRMMFAMIGARSLFTIISKATRQYMARNEELSAKLKTMWATLGQLIGPIIEFVINLILKLMGYLMSFLKLLGVNTDALKKQAKASQASAKAQERQLAAFDEMNKLSDSTDSKGMADLPEFDIGSLDDIGKNLAKKINDLLDDINWEKIQLKVFHIVEEIVRQINNFISELNWTLLGWNIAQGLNTAILAVYAFITQFDWATFATKMSQLFATAISNIDWGKIAVILIVGTINLLTAWYSFLGQTLANTNWQRIADNIKTGLAKIDWKTILVNLAAAFLKALTELLIAKFLILPSLISSFIAGIFEGLGFDAIAGFFKGISDKLIGVAEWLRKNVFDPIINAFKSLFGIHSPSTVFEGFGIDIMQGLFNGISSMINSIIQLWEDIKTKILNIWSNIKSGVTEKVSRMKDSVSNIFSGLWDNMKKTINAIISGVESMANGIINGVNGVIRALNRLSFTIPDWVPGYGGKSIGFNLSTLGTISIPRLAQGAVIPPNREFMAVLGDQKSGMNIEAPLDTIVEAFKRVQDEGNQPIVVQLVVDGKVLARTVAENQRKLDFSFNR